MAEETPQIPENANSPERSETPSETPARRGPPIVIAEEILSSKGEVTAKALTAVVGRDAITTGGRDDIPWARVAADVLPAVAKRCRDDASLGMDMLHCLLAVDYVDRIELDYILFSIAGDRKAILKVDLPADSPSAPTVTDLWAAAAWYERETHDLFGVHFDGNDDLEPLLLYEGFEGHPGLKSFPLHEYEEF